MAQINYIKENTVKIIKCIDDVLFEGKLCNGNYYEATKEDEHFYYIINDRLEHSNYLKHRFEEVMVVDVTTEYVNKFYNIDESGNVSHKQISSDGRKILTLTF